MASSGCCEVPGRAWSSLCWEGQGGHTLILSPVIHPGQHGVVLSITVPIFPVLGSAVRADYFISGWFCSAVGAGSKETLSIVVPWPWWPPACMTRVWLAKGLQERGHFPLPVVVILLCRGCSRGKAGTRNFMDSSYDPGAVSSWIWKTQQHLWNCGNKKLKWWQVPGQAHAIPSLCHWVPGCPSDLSGWPFRAQGSGRREMP